jgi:hypothetical protein
VATTGDIGRPGKELSRDFPWLAPHLRTLEGAWWHSPEQAPNCCKSRQFKSKESLDSVRVRRGAGCC